jgi:hypothetical protein
MDTISLAATVAFAMELKKTVADFGVSFGNSDNLFEWSKNRAAEESTTILPTFQMMSESTAQGLRHALQGTRNGELRAAPLGRMVLAMQRATAAVHLNADTCASGIVGVLMTDPLSTSANPL